MRQENIEPGEWDLVSARSPVVVVNRGAKCHNCSPGVRVNREPGPLIDISRFLVRMPHVLVASGVIIQ